MGQAVHRSEEPPRPAARAIRELRKRARPWPTARLGPTSTVDGGVRTTSACAACSDACSCSEAHAAGRPTARSREADRRPGRSLVCHRLGYVGTGPAPSTMLLKSSGVPIDHYSCRGVVELLQRTSRRAGTRRAGLRDLADARPTRASPGMRRRSTSRTRRSTPSTWSFLALQDRPVSSYLNYSRRPSAPPEAVGSHAAAAWPDHRRLAHSSAC